ncbi:MAG: ABC transporter permease [Planctomycetes bacterium]|nr:ABC transporter permease [Planctomycetota bacterium]
MRNTYTIFKRELSGYFATPVAYVVLYGFLFFAFALTFLLGNFFTGQETDQATLQGFFTFHPFLYLFFLPEISMRLWSEERRVGTIELLMTLPVTVKEAVIGKYLAAWALAGLMLALTFPIWITVNYLGEPDNGVILASYIGSFLMAGAYLAIGAFLSALTRNQIIAAITTVLLGVAFLLPGVPFLTQPLSGIASPIVVDTLRSFSFLAHFESITKGLIDLRDLVYFGSLIVCFLLANALVVQVKKAD